MYISVKKNYNFGITTYYQLKSLHKKVYLENNV